MPFYVADYLADTGRLSTLEHGAYLLLIMDYWRNGGIPDDDRKLARIARMSDADWLLIRANIAELFHDGWSHKRIDAEIAKSTAKSDAARASAMRRHYPGDANAMRTQCEGTCERDANDMLSQPQSQKKEKKEGDANASLVNAEPLTPAPIDLKFERDRKRHAEEREALRCVGEAWNAMAGDIGLACIDEIPAGSAREKAALARIREARNFEIVFAKIRGSPFLRGDSGKWKADFNWVMNPTNILKIIEGNYDEIRQTTARRPDQKPYQRGGFER